VIYNAFEMSEVLEKRPVEQELTLLKTLVSENDLFGAMSLATEIIQSDQSLQPSVRETLGEKMDMVLLFLFRVKDNPNSWERLELLKNIRVDYPEAMDYLRNFLRFEYKRYKALGEQGMLSRAGTLFSLRYLNDLLQRGK
jgi:hypothetical protein